MSDLVVSLLHTIWQGAILSLLLLIVLRCLPVKRVNARYLASCLAFFLLAALPLFNYSLLTLEANPAPSISQENGVGRGSADAFIGGNAFAEPSILETSPDQDRRDYKDDTRRTEGWRQALFIVWIFGSALGLLRIFLSLGGVFRIRYGAQGVEDEKWEALSQRVGLRKAVRILSSSRIDVAAVCGIFKPVILVPASYFSGLNPIQIEAIIIHELAHIRRYDHWVNFMQLLAEAFLFFNPFLWWVSAQIRREREAACDQIAVSLTGRPQVYVDTLTEVAEGSVIAQPAVMPAFPGSNQKGELLERARRLLVPGFRPQLQVRIPVLCFLLFIGFVSAVLIQISMSAALKALSPEERIEVIAELHEQYPQHVFETDPTEGLSEDQEVLISGQVLGPDNTVLDERIRIRVYRQRGSSGTHFSIKTQKDGSFEIAGENGSFELMAYMEGLAPAYKHLGVVTENLEGVEIRMNEGFSSKVQFVSSEDGTPLVDVSMSARVELHAGGGIGSFQSDKEGYVELRDLSETPLRIEAQLDGFGEDQWNSVILENEGTLQLELEPVAPLELVVSDPDGELIKGAKLFRASREGMNLNLTWGVAGNEPINVSGGDGVLYDRRMSPRARYYYRVYAEGYVGQIVGPYFPGDREKVQLKPAQNYNFEFRDIPADLLDESGRLGVCVSESIRTGPHSSYGLQDVQHTLDVKNGVARLEYTPKWQLDELELILGSSRDLEIDINPDRLSIDQAYVVDFSNRRNGSENVVVDSMVHQMGAVELKINVPDGHPPANGVMEVRFVKGGVIEGHKRRTGLTVVDVKDGVAHFDIPVPNEIFVSPEGIQGYWFDAPGRMKVSAQNLGTPTRFELDAVPAGAIYGRILDQEGERLIGGVLISVLQWRQDRSKLDDVNVKVKDSAHQYDANNAFLASPLPLGHGYVIVAHTEAAYVVSQDIHLDASKPTQELIIKIPEGINVRGRVTDEFGDPIRGVAMSLELDLSDRYGFGRSGPISGADGGFQIVGLNPDIRGEYFLEIKDVLGYQPIRYKIDFARELQHIQLKRGQKIQGIVRESGTGKIIPGAEVYAVRTEYVQGAWPSWWDTAKTDSEGRFEFTNLPEGEYKILSRSGKVTGKGPIVRTGNSEPVNLEIELYDWTDLTPVAP